MLNIVVIIPALNEEKSIGKVLKSIPPHLAAQVIIADNDSSDDTASVARAHGATVVLEKRRGYGWACLRGMKEAEMETVAGLMHEALSNREDSSKLEAIRLQVVELNKRFPLP